MTSLDPTDALTSGIVWWHVALVVAFVAVMATSGKKMAWPRRRR